MKLEISIEKLKDAVGKAEKVTSKGATLESLKAIFLLASGNSLKLRSTNLSLGLEIEIAAKIETEGEVLVSGEVFNNTLQNLSVREKTLSLELQNENLVISSAKSKVVIKSLVAAEGFPELPEVEGESFEIETGKFLEGIRSVFYSAAITDIKPEIGSVFLYSEDDKVVFVATDSFRLAEKKVKVKNLRDIESIIIPYKNILEINKLLGDAKGDLKVSYNKNQISFILPGFYLTSRLINGSFPDYRQIVPKSYKTRAIILKKDLIEALRLSNIFSDKFNQIKLRVDPKGKLFEIEAVNKDVGENKSAIDAALEGEPIEMNLNHKYVLDCFQSINEDSVVLEIGEPNRPVVMKGNGDVNFLYLIMPMNR